MVLGGSLHWIFQAMALLYKLEQHTVELVKLSRRIVELSREMEAKWSQKSV